MVKDLRWVPGVRGGGNGGKCREYGIGVLGGVGWLRQGRELWVPLVAKRDGGDSVPCSKVLA